ncbi:MAG: DMT family transporter [Clostridium sp.]|nr:DMT family transporter [Clostridium sp.]
MKQKAGYLYLLITFFIWGSLYVISKYALASIPPVTVLLLRYIIAIVVLIPMLMKKGRKPVKREHIKYFLIIGLLGYFVSIAFQLIGTSLVDSSLASLINSINPITISIMAAIFLKEKLECKKVISIALSVIGVYVILGTSGGSINYMGIGASILSVILWSAASIAIRKVSDEYNPVQIALYGMAIALILNIPASIAELSVKPCTFTIPAVLSVIYLGVVCTGVAHTLWNLSLQLLDASTCSMFYPLQPLTSALLGIVLLNEKITVDFVIGGSLILFGILISVIKFKKKDVSLISE